MDHISMNVGEAKIPTAVAIGELLVVEAQLVEHGRVKVVDVHLVLYRLEPKVIGSSMNVSAFDTTSRHPSREPVMIVVSSVDLAGIGSLLGHLDHRSSPKFPSPKDQGFVEHASLFEINE
jgi:hypothetical protein